MKPCVVGIGGAGGNILKQFLQSLDLELMIHNFGDHLTYGEVKGVWIESASQDTQNQKDHFYGSLIDEKYPGYLICHENVKADSPTRTHVTEMYGFDLKAPGFDRRAEYLKGLFEVFEFDPILREKCFDEFKGYDNPLSSYMWKKGIRPFTIIDIGGLKTGLASTRAKEADNSAAISGAIEGKVSEIGSKHLSLIPSFIKVFSRRGGGKGIKSTTRCDSILFLASLGGGTGTGFINPITSSVRSDEPIFPIFTLGILTEKGPDKRSTSEGQRDLGAVIALYDLLTKESGKGIDGLILIDNQILKQRFDGDFSAMNGEIYRALKPLLDLRNYPGDDLQDDSIAIRRVIWETDTESNNNSNDDLSQKRLLPPVLVPCYYTQPDWQGDLNTLVDGALGKNGHISELGLDGRLFPCDPSKAERALVFIRGFFKTEEINDVVMDRTGLTREKIRIYRKLGDSKVEDILILLRNPYGGQAGAQNIKGTLEWRFHDIISESIKYIQENQMNILGYLSYKDLTKEHLNRYFYGMDGLNCELKRSLKCIERGRKPFFCRGLRIFGDSTTPDNSRNELNSNTSDLDEQIKGLVNDLVDQRLRLHRI